MMINVNDILLFNGDIRDDDMMVITMMIMPYGLPIRLARSCWLSGHIGCCLDGWPVVLIMTLFAALISCVVRTPLDNMDCCRAVLLAYRGETYGTAFRRKWRSGGGLSSVARTRNTTNSAYADGQRQ
jgi:hypothetical protein